MRIWRCQGAYLQVVSEYLLSALSTLQGSLLGPALLHHLYVLLRMVSESLRRRGLCRHVPECEAHCANGAVRIAAKLLQ
jgi:hypothetical protein